MGRASKTRQTKPRPMPAVTDECYRLLVEQTGEGIIAFDRDLRIRMWNQGMARMTGLAADECVGRPVAKVLASVGVVDAEASLTRTLRGDRSVLLPLPSGGGDRPEARSYEANYHPIPNGTDDALAGMVVVRDITERPGFKEVNESERKHRLRFLHAADAILVIDRNGHYIDANPAASELTGYSREELLSMSVPALSLPEERASAKERFGQLLGTGVSRRERVVQRKDGTHVHVEAYAIDLGDGTLQTTVRDISERKAAEEQLHEVLQRLRFHIERMPLAYIVWTTDMRILECNPACERLFGWTAEEILGKSWMDLVPEHTRPQVRKVVSELLAGDMSSQSINDNVRKDGSIITCEWFNTPLRDSSGEIRVLASMVQDVTEREAAEAQLRHAQKLESLGTLTRGIAHDFGNLLMVVLGNLTLLKNKPGLGKSAKEHLSLMEEAATKASELTDHLLAFARTGRHNPERADLNAIIRDALKLVRASLAHDVRVEVNLDKKIPKIYVDRGQTEQVLMNLCLNAAQAMPNGGTIIIKTANTRLSPEDIPRCVPHENRKPGPRVALIVRDTGHGMDEGTVSRIFDPFFSTRAEGHGLGMAAVLGILKQHEAHVVTDSVPGEGTTFHIYFPIRGGSSIAARTDQRTRATGSTTSRPTRSKAKPQRDSTAARRQTI